MTNPNNPNNPNGAKKTDRVGVTFNVNNHPNNPNNPDNGGVNKGDTNRRKRDARAGGGYTNTSKDQLNTAGHGRVSVVSNRKYYITYIYIYIFI